ncbi:NUDIX domain-containing protein [Nonomuraea sp. M3C6]|uniref:NUDIX domain-containing protein n=1 Tax=Nonomuraea marmarensis TaxID=3351344 RepID=A0ABW7AIY2_9ACTN
MDQRERKAQVRAIAITEDDHLLTIKRIKPGQNPYWVLPGGGVDAQDASLEEALHREIREELAGEADLTALVSVLETVLLPGPHPRLRFHRAQRTGVRRT